MSKKEKVNGKFTKILASNIAECYDLFLLLHKHAQKSVLLRNKTTALSHEVSTWADQKKRLQGEAGKASQLNTLKHSLTSEKVKIKDKKNKKKIGETMCFRYIRKL